jgi:hypothetical protein
VQAIYQTENFGSVPLSYYASRDIEIEGNTTTMDNMSIFAKRNIIGLRPGNIRGTDLTYGDWANLPGNAGPNAHNATQRTDYQGLPVIAAGAAAPGTACRPSRPGVEYAPNSTENAQKDPSAAQVASNSQVYGYRDYDGCTDTELVPPLPVASRRPEFAENDWGVRANQPSTKITYPFAPPSPTEDAQAMTVLKERAQIQGLYFRVAPGSTFNISSPPYPASSNLQNTVMFVEFAGGTDDGPAYGAKGHAIYDARSSDADNLVKGTIVVMNGDLKIGQNADDFQGALIVRDPLDAGNDTDTTAINCNDTGTRMDYCSAGQVDIQGWVNVQSDIKIAGSVDGWLPSEMSTGLTSIVKVSQYSWRECYNRTCN